MQNVVVVELETTKGKVVLEVHRDWSPKGAERFLDLVKQGFYNDIAFFRVIDGFMAQTGLSGNPQTSAQWINNNIEDEPVKQSNKRGYVSFAKTALPNTRSTQFFINFVDNVQLDAMGFAPFAKVRDMSNADKLYKGYAEQPNQSLIQRQGNAYLKSTFPNLDYIIRATIIK